MDDLRIEAPASEPTVITTRTFAAPRALVWKAMSQPEHVVRWFGPHSHTNEVLTFDWQVGGKWRIRSTTPEGMKITFFGEYLEIAAPEKLVQTFGVEEMYGDQTVTETVTLRETNGVTYYTNTSHLPDFASRDGMIASGMEVGVREGFERLDRMLREFMATA